MKSKIKIITRNKLIPIVLVLLLFAVMAICFEVSAVNDNVAEAAELGWEATVRYKNGSSGSIDDYLCLGTGDTLTDSNVSLYCFIKFLDSSLAGNNTFFYTISANSLSEDERNALPRSKWTQITSDMEIVDANGTTFIYNEYNVGSSSFSGHFYFCRIYNVTDAETGVSVEHVEYYPHKFYIRVNAEISPEDIGIESVSAQFLRGNTYVKYDGSWIASSLQFTIETKYMKNNNTTYNKNNELLYYSINDGINWIPIESNTFILSGVALTDKPVNFKVTSVNKQVESFYTYGINAEERKVNMDPYSPSFSISATTLDISGESVDYTSESWTSNSVNFSITNESSCNSEITYYYSADNSDYVELSSTKLTIPTTKKSVRFRAQNKAGTIYNFDNTYIVNIDKAQPNVNISATTPDPDSTNDKDVKNLSADTTDAQGIILLGNANGQINIYVYNRDIAGNGINNASGTTFLYRLRTESGIYPNSWTKMTQKGSGDVDCYRATDTITKDMNITKYYQFKILSGAGLESRVVEVKFTLVKSNFAIELDKVTASVNSLGWIADKAVVSMVMPTDSVQTSGTYSQPTTAYTFYYTASDGTSAEASAQGRAIVFYEENDGINYWLYEFDLIASADSTFYIYARNAAGKKSVNTVETPDKIAIDVLEPVYTMSAYVLPTDPAVGPNDYLYLDTENPGWVNGSIVLTLKVKVGVSGVHVKDMIYATDSNGNILTDTVSGQIVWQEKSTIRNFDEAVLENEIQYYCYYVAINMEDNTKLMMSRDYKFRIYTGSGIYKEISFTANIDTTDTIRLDSVSFESGEKDYNLSVTDGNGLIDMNDYGYAVCDDISIAFTSSIDTPEFADHYTIYYCLFDGTGISDLLQHASTLYGYKKLTEPNISVNVENGKKGTVYIAVYVENLAKKYDGSQKKSGYYVISVSYDTVNLIIGYDIAAFSPNGDDVTENMDEGKWISGYLEVILSIYINAEGDTKADSSYTFYYMLIDASVTNISSAIASGKWIEAVGGSYGADGRFTFAVNFIESSFNGRLAFSVKNGAGYRNTQDAASAKIVKVDNTTPQIDEAIVYQNAEAGNLAGVRGEIGAISVNGTATNLKLITYYSTKEIFMQGITDANRSGIDYYYMYLGTTIDANTAILTSDFTQLTQRTGVFAATGNFDTGVSNYLDVNNNPSYHVAYYAIYAVNEVGANADGAIISDSATNTVTFDTVYCFVYDSSKLSGEWEEDKTVAYYKDSINMWAYSWVQNAKITILATGSALSSSYEKYVQFGFSIDNGLTWYTYMDMGIAEWYTANTKTDLMFNTANLRYYEDSDGNHPFANGVDAAFMFRAVNKAGAVKLFKKVYISIDETVPEFDIHAVTDKGINYLGGSTDSLTSGDEVWTSGPITINIDMTVTPVSGYKITYYLEYLADGTTHRTKGEGENGKELKNLTFTTDMLDGFNKNRDAILYIKATSNSGEEFFSEKSIRLSVDQVVPEFTLLGHVGSKTITSGEWTNQTTVSISKAELKKNQNVSEVVYTYTYRDSTSTEVTEYTWTAEEGNITKSNSCVIVVTALTKAGLTYSQTFEINIDTVAPVIKFDGNINVIEDQEYYIDLKVYVEEANIKICEYITIKGDERGFAFDPTGYILSTSSVDNSIRYDSFGNEYRGYVKVFVMDYAGNSKTFVLYILPFALTVNNVTLSDEDLAQIEEYSEMLTKASAYMESSRVAYFSNLISRLDDRVNTLRKEIKGYQDYLEKLSNRSSFELRSDYAEMFDYMETYNDYALYGQAWIQDAIKGDSTSKYYAYYQNFLTQFGKLQALMDKVKTVETNVIALPAINMVERGDYEDILRIYDEYKDLTMDQKACFTANLYNKLLDLKESCEVLLLTDADLGISIDGDFAPGATINVTGYDASTDTYINAQNLLAETVSSSSPRKVVSINRIALNGAYSQTVASDIVVSLPIPADYQNYINFAVYELSDNGSIKLINNTEIQADGKSIVFSTDSLTTYVLCVKAELAKTDTTENEYGSILGISLTVKMIRYLIYGGIALFALVIIIIVVMGIRHRRFLNTYNKAYRHSVYRRGVKGIPKGNKVK